MKSSRLRAKREAKKDAKKKSKKSFLFFCANYLQFSNIFRIFAPILIVILFKNQ